MYKGCTIHVQRVYTLNDIVNKVLNDIIHEIVYKRQDAFGSPRGGKLCCLGVLLINMANVILPKSLRARDRTPPDFSVVITRVGKGSLPDDVAAADELRASTSRDSKNDLKSIVLPVICQ